MQSPGTNCQPSVERRVEASKAISARRRGQRGNTFLELSLCFLPMLAMFLGMIDVAFAIYVQSNLTTAAREGTRFAVTYSPSYNGTSCASSQATCITQAAQYNAMGFLSGNNSNYITVNYYTAANLSTPVMTCNAGSCTLPNSICGSSQNSACTNGSLAITLSSGVVVNYVNQPGNVVEVSIAGYPWNWIAPLPGYSGGTGVTLGADSVDVLNGLGVGTSTPPNP